MVANLTSAGFAGGMPAFGGPAKNSSGRRSWLRMLFPPTLVERIASDAVRGRRPELTKKLFAMVKVCELLPGDIAIREERECSGTISRLLTQLSFGVHHCRHFC